MGLLEALRKFNSIGNPSVKDFTEDAEEKMKKMANENVDEDPISRYVVDPVGRFLDKTGCLYLLSSIIDYQKEIIDCYNYSAQNIEDICETARRYDTGSDAQRVSLCFSQASNVVKLVNCLGECLDGNSEYFDKNAPISYRLQWLNTMYFNGEAISNIAEDAKDIDRQLDNTNITNAEIEEFCSDSQSENLFKDYTDQIFDKEMDWGALGIVFVSAGTVIYKGAEMTIDQLLSVLTKEGYGDKLVREQLNAMIASVISANNTVETMVKDHGTAKKIVENLIKDYLKDEDKDGTFKKFVEAMGGITFVKELGESCPQLLDYLFSDYKNGLEIIDNIASTCDKAGTPEMQKAIKKLREDYESKWKGIFNKTQNFNIKMIEKLGEEGVKEFIKKNIGDTYVLLKVLEVTDMKEHTEGWHKLLAQKKIVSDLQDAYEAARNKIDSGDYTEDDVKYMKNMFNMLKEATKKVYQTYKDTCTDPSKKIWLAKKIDTIDKITMGYYGVYTFDAS